MTTSFPFTFVDLGTPLPFKIEANPDFPTETEPVCILNNLGDPGEDTFITIGPANPDPWELTFRWATAGGAAVGTWQLDAFLQRIGPGPNLVVPGFPETVGPGAVSPGKWDHAHFVTPFPPGFAPGVHLFRLYATLRWLAAGGSPLVKVAGRAEGPLIEFYVPV
jgi:hypothetical protein